MSGCWVLWELEVDWLLVLWSSVWGFLDLFGFMAVGLVVWDHFRFVGLICYLCSLVDVEAVIHCKLEVVGYWFFGLLYRVSWII